MLAQGAGVLRAQSGRNRGVPTAASGDAGKPPAGNRGGVEAPPATDAQAEVVEGDVVRVDTSLVTVPVSVRDRQGRYAPDLRREDFRVFEDGVEQQIAYFAAVDQPFTVALVLDTSGSTEFSLGDIQRAASAFVEQLKPADRVTVISFDDRIDVLCEPTSDRQELNRAIRRAHGGGSTRLFAFALTRSWRAGMPALPALSPVRVNHGLPVREGARALIAGTESTSVS